MREIKFRVWDSFNKKMNYQDEVIIMLDKDGIGTCFDTGSRYSHFEDLEKDLVYMQYTGLKDMNENEIYEDDLVFYQSDAYELIGKIVYGLYDKELKTDLGFHIDWFNDKNTRNDLGYWVNKGIRVLGNVYEISEFLSDM